MSQVTRGFDSLHVVPCGPERAEEVYRLTQAAFASYLHLDPPSGAGRESMMSNTRMTLARASCPSVTM